MTLVFANTGLLEKMYKPNGQMVKWIEKQFIQNKN